MQSKLKTKKETLEEMLIENKNTITRLTFLERFYHRAYLSGKHKQAVETLLAKTQQEIRSMNEMVDFLNDMLEEVEQENIVV